MLLCWALLIVAWCVTCCSVKGCCFWCCAGSRRPCCRGVWCQDCAPRLKPASKVLKKDKSVAQPVELRRLATRIAHPPFHVLKHHFKTAQFFTMFHPVAALATWFLASRIQGFCPTGISYLFASSVRTSVFVSSHCVWYFA